MTTLDVDTLIARWIEPHPKNPGKAEARLKHYYVPVRALIGDWPLANGDPAALASAYAVPIEAVEAALAYYQRYRSAIDDRLAVERELLDRLRRG